MGILNATLVIIIIAAVIGIIYIVYYNKMQYLKTKIEQAEGVIDETLRSRYDALVRANDILKTTLKDNKDYFKEVISLKDKNITNFELDRKLKDAFITLNKFVDDYQELAKNKDLKEILATIKSTDERIAATTGYYNKYTNELNSYVRKFPSVIIAKIHHFKVSPFFDRKDMTDDIYDDFKIK